MSEMMERSGHQDLSTSVQTPKNDYYYDSMFLELEGELMRELEGELKRDLERD